MVLMIQLLHERRYGVKESFDFAVEFYGDLCLLPFNVFFVCAALLGSNLATKSLAKNTIQYYLEAVDVSSLQSYVGAVVGREERRYIQFETNRGTKKQLCSLMNSHQFCALLSYLFFHVLVPSREDISSEDLIEAKNMLEYVPKEIPNSLITVCSRKFLCIFKPNFTFLYQSQSCPNWRRGC